MFPDFWRDFIAENGLAGMTFSIPEEADRSGMGAELAVLTPEQSADEAQNFWPGMGVAKDGYVPVGSCLAGSGDYYYVRTQDGAGGPLYRVYHDAVDEDGYDADEAIAVVLDDHRTLLGYVER